MATVNITEQYLSDIGDAIREKRDVTTKYKPSQMASAIRGIRSASDVKLIPKVIRENGRYESLAEDNADGYNVISVDVVGRDAIVDDLTITENGTYNPADSGLDYFSQVTAEVEAEPNVDSKTITSNGTYLAEDDELDGYDEVTVNVSPNVGSKSITANGNYQAESDNLDGYSSVSVNVEPNVGTKTITENGIYIASADELDGYSRVTVNVSGGGGNIEIIQKDDWDEMTTEQKRAKGLVVVQTATTGYIRGIYVNGADYIAFIQSEMTPIYSWNESKNNTRTYNFLSTTLSGNDTLLCMAVVEQNGNNPSSDSNLAEIRSGSDGNGNYAVYLGAYSENSYASTYSGGDNWNNSGIVCFAFSTDVVLTIKELFYEQGKSGTYTYTYQATATDTALLLVCMRGGSEDGSYTIAGLTQTSHVTSTGARFNDVYFDEVDEGDEVSINIPYRAGSSNNGSLLVILFSM